MRARRAPAYAKESCCARAGGIDDVFPHGAERLVSSNVKRMNNAGRYIAPAHCRTGFMAGNGMQRAQEKWRAVGTHCDDYSIDCVRNGSSAEGRRAIGVIARDLDRFTAHFIRIGHGFASMPGRYYFGGDRKSRIDESPCRDCAFHKKDE